MHTLVAEKESVCDLIEGQEAREGPLKSRSRAGHTGVNFHFTA